MARVHDLIFGPRGDRLAANAAGADGKTALLWLEDGRRGQLGTLRNGKVALAMSRDGRIATGEQDGSIQLWSDGGAGPLAVLRGHGAEIHALAFSRDGQRLLSASLDGSARVWALGRPGPPVPILLRGHEDWVLGAAFDVAERRVVTASSDGTARVWDLAEPEQPIVLRGHAGDVRYAGFTPEGRVVTASFDGTVRLWSLDEGAADPRALMEQLRQATSVCLTPDQRMRYLEEPAAISAERFAACERAAGRGP
jgi:WD40 repeat protein